MSIISFGSYPGLSNKLFAKGRECVYVCVRLSLERTSSCQSLRDVRVAPAHLVTICTDYQVS